MTKEGHGQGIDREIVEEQQLEMGQRFGTFSEGETRTRDNVSLVMPSERNQGEIELPQHLMDLELLKEPAVNRERSLLVYVLVILIEIFGALGIGYATAVAGGVLAMDKFMSMFFPKIFYQARHAKENNYCSYSNQVLLLYVSFIYIFAMIGIFVGVVLLNAFRQHVATLVASLLSVSGAVLTVLAPNAVYLYVGRLLIGVGVGITSKAINLIVVNTQEKNTRDLLDRIFGIFVIMGNVLAYLANFFSDDHPTRGWWLSLGGVGIFGIFQLLVSILSLAVEPSREGSKVSWRSIRCLAPFRRTRHPDRQRLWMAILTKLYVKIIGVDVISFYAPLILLSLGYSTKESYLSALVIEIVSLVLVVGAMCMFIRFGAGRERRISIALFMIVSMAQGAMGILLIWQLDPMYFPKKWVAAVIMILILTLVSGYALACAPEGCLSVTFEDENAANTIVAAIDFFFSIVITHALIPVSCQIEGWVFIACFGCTAFLGSYLLILLEREWSNGSSQQSEQSKQSNTKVDDSIISQFVALQANMDAIVARVDVLSTELREMRATHSRDVAHLKELIRGLCPPPNPS